MEIYTEARVAKFNGDLNELISKYSKKFIKFPIGRPEILKYFLLEGEEDKKTTIMISQNMLGFALGDKSYDIILTVYSANREQTKITTQSIESKLGIVFTEAPSPLKDFGKGLGFLIGP